MVAFFGACATFLGEAKLFLSVKPHLMKWQVESVRRWRGQAAASEEQPKRSRDGRGTSPTWDKPQEKAAAVPVPICAPAPEPSYRRQMRDGEGHLQMTYVSY